MSFSCSQSQCVVSPHLSPSWMYQLFCKQIPHFKPFQKQKLLLVLLISPSHEAFCVDPASSDLPCRSVYQLHILFCPGQAACSTVLLSLREKTSVGPSVELQNGLSILNNTRGEQGLMENIKP